MLDTTRCRYHHCLFLVVVSCGYSSQTTACYIVLRYGATEPPVENEWPRYLTLTKRRREKNAVKERKKVKGFGPAIMDERNLLVKLPFFSPLCLFFLPAPSLVAADQSPSPSCCLFLIHLAFWMDSKIDDAKKKHHPVDRTCARRH